MQCGLCYEECEDTVTLPCGNIACTSCLLEDYINESLFCQLCLKSHIGVDIRNLRDDECDCLDTEQKNSSVSINAADHSQNDETWMRSGPRSPFIKCIEPNCKFRALCGQWCYAHVPEQKRKSLSARDKSAKSLADTSLVRVASEISPGTDSSRKTYTESINALRLSCHPSRVFERFRKQERLLMAEVVFLIESSEELVRSEPNILPLTAPLLSVGDLHGQFFDLCNILTQLGGQDHLSFNFMENCSESGSSPTQLLFLGDYVDRGSFSCEVMLGLMSMKLAFPQQVFLIRGNHECVSLTHHFGFREECRVKYGMTAYHLFCGFFRSLPIAATVDTHFGKLIACHGGLSPSFSTLEDIQNINRFVEPEHNAALLDLLWADPLTDDGLLTMADEDYQAFLDADWRPNARRGCSYMFGMKMAKEFLEKNNLVCIVRAHEVQNEGYKRHFEPSVIAQRSEMISNELNLRHSSVDGNSLVSDTESIGSTQSGPVVMPPPDFETLPPVITVFSAPNYCDRYDNQGAILKIGMELSDFEFIQYDCVEHPTPIVQAQSEAEKHLEIITTRCPYMPTTFRQFVELALYLGPAEILMEEEDADVKEGMVGSESTVSDMAALRITVESNNTSLAGSQASSASPTPKSSIGYGKHRDSSLTISPVHGNFQCARTGNTATPSAGVRPVPMTPIRGSVQAGILKLEPEEMAVVDPMNIFSPTVSRPLKVHVFESRDTSEKVPDESMEVNPLVRPAADGTFNSVTSLVKKGFAIFKRTVSITRPPLSVFQITSPRNGYNTGIASPKMFFSPKGRKVAKSSLFTCNEVGPTSHEENTAAATATSSLEPSDADGTLSETRDSGTSEVPPPPPSSASAPGTPPPPPAPPAVGYVALPSPVPAGSSAFVQAVANDAINEYHPRRLDKVFKGNQWLQKPKPVRDAETVVITETVNKMFELESSKKPSAQNYSVAELRLRYERAQGNTPKRLAPGEETITPTKGLRGKRMAEVEQAAVGVKVSTLLKKFSGNLGTASPAPVNPVELPAVPGEAAAVPDSEPVLFNPEELVALRLLFSLFDRSNSGEIAHDDLVAYAEDSRESELVRFISECIEVIDIDNSNTIGFLDFVHFAERVKRMHAEDRDESIVA